MSNKKMLAEILKVNRKLRKRVQQETILLKRIDKVQASNLGLAEQLHKMLNAFETVTVPALPA